MSAKKILQSRRTALAGGAALVIGGIAASALSVSASPRAEADDPATSDVFVVSPGDASGPFAENRQKWVKAVADKLGTTPDKLDAAMRAAAKELGFPEVPLIAPFPLLGAPGGPPMSGGFSLHIESPLTPAAKALGISEEQLKTEWASKSLNDIARAHNVDPKVIADAIKAQRQAELDKAVADSKLSQEIADRLKSHLADEIDQLMTQPGGPGRMVFRFEQRGVAP